MSRSENAIIKYDKNENPLWNCLQRDMASGKACEPQSKRDRTNFVNRIAPVPFRAFTQSHFSFIDNLGFKLSTMEKN